MQTMASVFKALSDETRLSMLGLLFREGELCVCDFVEVLGVTQSKASRHLRYLVHAGLLQDRRKAVWVYFRIHEQPAPVQGALLKDLRKSLMGYLPKDLWKAFAKWQQCKNRYQAACCKGCAEKKPRKSGGR